ncbi:MAG: PIN domain-containing protein [Candidatus Woesearchaeota archaeon]
MKLILDSSFIIDLLNNKIDAVKKSKEIEEKEIIMTTSISVFETLKRIRPESEIKNTKDFFKGIIVLELNKNSGLIAGDISRELLERGKEIDSEDCMIAGIAIINNETVLTKNVKHFNRIKGLKVESY